MHGTFGACVSTRVCVCCTETANAGKSVVCNSTVADSRDPFVVA